MKNIYQKFFLEYCRFMSKDLIAYFDENTGRDISVIEFFRKIFFIIHNKDFPDNTKHRALNSLEKAVDEYNRSQSEIRVNTWVQLDIIGHFISTEVLKGIENDPNDFIGQFSFPEFSQLNNPRVYIAALSLAIVASLETLLSVEATDKLDPYRRITPTNRELVAQGVANTISGMIGGLPITQVIIRSSANIQSGGKTKASAFIHGLLLLVAVAFIPGLLNLIPLSSYILRMN